VWRYHMKFVVFRQIVAQVVDEFWLDIVLPAGIRGSENQYFHLR
jgi:hypothetical protein